MINLGELGVALLGARAIGFGDAEITEVGGFAEGRGMRVSDDLSPRPRWEESESTYPTGAALPFSPSFSTAFFLSISLLSEPK